MKALMSTKLKAILKDPQKRRAFQKALINLSGCAPIVNIYEDQARYKLSDNTYSSIRTNDSIEYKYTK